MNRTETLERVIKNILAEDLFDDAVLVLTANDDDVVDDLLLIPNIAPVRKQIKNIENQIIGKCWILANFDDCDDVDEEYLPCVAHNFRYSVDFAPLDK